MIDRGQSWAVIFEDDAELLPQFASQLAMMEIETRDFDMAQLYAFRDPDKLHHVSRDGAFKVMRYSGPHGSAAAYAMRLSGAKKLMSIDKVWTVADKWTWLSAVTGLKCCGIMPYPVKLEEQHSVVSTISGAAERKNNRLWLIAVLPVLRVIRFSISKVRGV
jgi:GR25 family glycosyltransferase involved in LPS biosynthesis